MIEGLKPYPQYRDSGIGWLGAVPAHWTVKRAKSWLHRVDIRSKTGKEELLTVSSARGVVPRNTTTVTMFKAKSYLGYKLCWPGDLVINSLWAWAGGLGVSRHHGIISSAYGVYRIRSDAPLHPGFVHEVVRSTPFNWELQVRSKGIWISRLQLTDDSFLNTPLHAPPPDEQAAIVRFLDHSNRRTDRFIRAKKKLIALLNEQKQAIIHRAVTRGLNPNVPMKDSGVPWLGQIPAHWEVRRIKQVARIYRGKFTHRPRNDPALYGGKYPFIQTGAVAQAQRTIVAYKQTLNESGLAVSKLFSAGTLVMTIAANIGDVAVLGFDSCFPDSIVGFKPSNAVLRDYIYLVFKNMKQEWLAEAPVNTQGNLNVERIGAMGIPVPEIGEQQTIVDSVARDVGPIDATTSQALREIDLMREYRTRLVADVVTGQLDVRDAARLLPAEELEPESPLDVDEDTVAEGDEEVGGSEAA